MKKLFKSIIITLSLCALIFSSPNLHNLYLRHKVGSKVVKITNKAGNSGGTGFHIKANSGDTYILTNAHICELAVNDIVYISIDEMRLIPKRVIEISEDTDLCLIEPLSRVSGLNMANAPSIGDKGISFGHPALMPLTSSSGEIIGSAEIKVMDHMMNDTDSEDTCNLPKNEIIEADTFFGKIKVCLIKIKSYMSTIIIRPGNSGSPVVNSWGNVLGVVFASDNEVHWALIVTNEQMRNFLKEY